MYEVAVIGGGLTGLMTATALSFAIPPQSARRIVLVDRAARDARPADERTSTIHAAGARMLTAMGVWERLAEPPAPVRRVAVAEGSPPTGLAARRRPASDLSWQADDAPMGYVVANGDLQTALRNALSTREVDEIRGATVTGWQADGGAAALSLDTSDGMRELRASLTVACDGAQSVIAEMAGLTRREERQHQTAIVTMIHAERHHEDTAWQRFLSGGPFALMPGPGQSMSLVWTLPNDEAARLIDADEAVFEGACLEAFGPRLGYLRLAGDRLAWPLRPSWRRRITAPGLVLAGDAAHAIHPLAGQGYNLALSDAAVLADHLHATLRRGLTADHPSLRSAYESARLQERLAMTTATSGLNRLFSGRAPALRRAAGIGFSVLDRLPVKSLFSDIAEGGALADAALLKGRLPGAG
jgi:2-octaprenyl-6-methoxyphenol hydroxylase